MKVPTLIRYSIVTVLGVGLTASIASAAAFDWNIPVKDFNDDPITVALPWDTDHTRFLTMYGPDGQPKFYGVDDVYLTFDDVNSELHVNDFPIAKITGLQSALDAKASATSLSSLSSTVAGLPTLTTVNNLISTSANNTLASSTSDWNITSTSSPAYIKNKPTMGKAIDGTTARNNAFPIFKQATVSGGNLVFHITSDGTSGGTALCSNGPISDSLQLQPEEGSAPHAFDTPVWSNGNKTVTIAATKIGTLLGILALNQSANGTLVRMNVWCY